jgi:uncharacterized membrane protein HdeD (DUF308 family)
MKTVVGKYLPMAHQEKEIVQMTTDRISSVVRHLWKSMLALGALALIVGVAVLIWPGESIVVAAALFGGYLLASGIAQVVAAFTVYTSAASRVLLFISGALSIVLGVVAFRDFNEGAAVWLLTFWIGIGFIFQGVSASALAISRAGSRLVHLRGSSDCDRWRGGPRVADRLHRGTRIHRGSMARRHRGRRDCVGLECAFDSQEGRARDRAVDEQRRRLTLAPEAVPGNTTIETVRVQT